MKLAKRDVLHDPALGMAGVFLPLKKGERSKLNVERTWGRATIRWRGPDQLGISDQSVLFAVLEVASEQMGESPSHGIALETDELWPLLGHQEHVFRSDTIRLTTSFARLVQLCGWVDGGTATQRVKDALRRLTETTVWASITEVDGSVREGSSRLLAWKLGDRHRVSLIVNWRQAQALRGTQYARISLLERGTLQTEVAQALHALLCCKINLCGAWSCGLDKLQVHVWGNAATGVNLRERRKRMRAALDAINLLHGWRVEFDAQIAHISRGPARTSVAPALAFRSRSGASVTVRPKRNAAASSPSHPGSGKVSAGAALQHFDVSALFSKRE